MSKHKFEYYAADFETTVFDNQEFTEVWAAACVKFYTEEVQIFHSLDHFFEHFINKKKNVCLYFHNLSFDGSFWLDYLLNDMKLRQAYEYGNELDINTLSWPKIKDMPNNSFMYSITALGDWYRIIIKKQNKIIEIRDSLKLLPFSLKAIGESFKTKHRKLEMEYKGFRYAGCSISEKEKKYIANDVLLLKEAMEIMFEEGHTKLTIGSCCLAEYKKIIGWKNFERLFPNVFEMILDPTKFGSENVGNYIKHSYRGGWVYTVKQKAEKIYKNGITADVNSLYPSMMHSDSGNSYPIGKPTFWKGNFIPEIAKQENYYYFVRIKTRFYLKKDYLPCIQIKRNLMYKPREYLETSDVQNPFTGKYSRTYIDFDGNEQPARVELTLTMTDFELIKEHYILEDFEILDGCYFRAVTGIFDKYIDKYAKIKLESTGALRTLAKLFLNNLYGKMAASPSSNFKVGFLNSDKIVNFFTVLANDKIPGYIPIGSAITSYARNFTIRAAQNNYYGPDKPGFIYADTDSIHCDLQENELIGLKLDKKAFQCWNLEANWDIAYFVRAKTYIEHVTHEENEKVNPYYNIKCAGMPERCKNLFRISLGENILNCGEFSADEKQFLEKKRTLEDFKTGLVIPGKLLPKRIPGGIILQETTFEIRKG